MAVWLIADNNDSHVSKVFSGTCVCLSVCFFRTVSQKPMQLESSNLIQKCSTMSPGNPCILESKGERSRSRGTKTVLVLLFTLQWVLASFCSFKQCFDQKTVKLQINALHLVQAVSSCLLGSWHQRTDIKQAMSLSTGVSLQIVKQWGPLVDFPSFASLHWVLFSAVWMTAQQLTSKN